MNKLTDCKIEIDLTDFKAYKEKYIIKDIKKELEKGFFLYVTCKNSPCTDIAKILKQTEKAVCIEIEHYFFGSVWVPISALEIDFSGLALTLKTWFRKSISDQYYTKKKLLLTA